MSELQEHYSGCKEFVLTSIRIQIDKAASKTCFQTVSVCLSVLTLAGV